MHNRKEKGVTLLVGTVSLVFIIPMIGLAIDVGFLYAVKSKLQAAVDGASLAAARSLNVGLTTDDQKTSATNNAVNWFNANFPSGYFGTQGTVMGDSNVSVFDSTGNPATANVRNVTVTATTKVDTFFMKWLGFGATTVGASGNASRRDAVVMLVLDRSFSIQMANNCGTMKAAAKTFTGQFAEGRDWVGLVSFSGDVLVSPPTQSFQTALGFTNDQGTGTGLIDNINCQGNTNTAQALSVAYNELWKINLPGALNVLMLETDGWPNTLTLNFWDGSAAGLSNSSNCKDKSGKTKASGGFATAASFSTLQWTPQIPLGTTSYLSGNPTKTAAGLVGAIGSTDPVDGSSEFLWMQQPYTGSMPPAASCNTSGCFQSAFANNGSTSANNCGFANSTSGYTGLGGNNYSTTTPDFAWFPATDVYGNQLNPSNAYKTVTMNGSHVSSTGSNPYQNFYNAAENAADNAAYQARTGVSLLSPNAGTPLQATIFVLGLGGTVQTTQYPLDFTLLARIANDPNGDNFNSTPAYQSCAQTTGCVTYCANPACTNQSPSQPQGTFIYSTSSADWTRAFQQLASQILRLSK